MLVWLSLLPLASLIGVLIWEWSAVVYLPEPTSGMATKVEDVSHAAWDELLRRYVDDSGRVTYREWKRSSEDMAALESYLRSLGSVTIGESSPREDQICYWINLYNALTVHGILREYPTRSILEHVRVVGYHFWKDLRVYADGRYVSLDDIEHGVLRPMGEPRIHFALVCASVGCPRLRREAYIPGRLDEQLNDNARHFFSREDSLRVFPGERQLGLSSLLKWYGKDFGKDESSMLQRLASFFPPEAAILATSAPAPKLVYLEYDWSLNDRDPPSGPR
jgi:hypothetical protein